jgi:hypothetical protein
MRIRTVYFKVGEQADPALRWWSSFLQSEPTKSFPPYYEFRVGQINFGLLALDAAPSPSCVPVFEFPDEEIAGAIQRAKNLGATTVLEGEAHPDYPNTAAVLRDPFGNEFEVTNYHGE